MRYCSVSSVPEALAVLKDNGRNVRILAGGTDVVVQLKEDKVTQDLIMDLSRIETLSSIRRDGDYISIGALATHSAIASSALLQECASPLVSACASVGSPQIRNKATMGGNVCHASPAGDSIPALMALAAHLHLESHRSDRWLPIEEFLLGPGKTARGDDELVTDIRFPAMRLSDCGFFLKLGQRMSLAIAKISVAGRLRLDNGCITEARIALGAVAPKVIRAQEAETYLAGKILGKEVASRAGLLAGRASAPIDDVRSRAGYRKKMVETLVERGLTGLIK